VLFITNYTKKKLLHKKRYSFHGLTAKITAPGKVRLKSGRRSNGGQERPTTNLARSRARGSDSTSRRNRAVLVRRRHGNCLLDNAVWVEASRDYLFGQAGRLGSNGSSKARSDASLFFLDSCNFVPLSDAARIRCHGSGSGCAASRTTSAAPGDCYCWRHWAGRIVAGDGLCADI
jgi:hypothetical protein